MKFLAFCARLLVAVCFGAVVWAFWLYNEISEHRKKRRLGSNYEGPID